MKYKFDFDWQNPVSLWKINDSVIILGGELQINTSGDHSPSLFCELTIFNFRLLDFSIYNIYHEI